MKLSEETKQRILNLQKLYPVRRSALIPALHIAQNETGYLPAEIQAEVAALFDIAPNEVNAIVAFYDMFHEKPVGKHLIHVCKNISCMLRGCDQLVEKLCEKLNVAPGEITADGKYTIIPSECLGACDRAPVILFDEEITGPVQVSDLEHLLTNKKGEVDV